MLKEKELLLAKLQDQIKISRKRPGFLGFLGEEEAAFCQDSLVREPDVQYLFWGGYEEAERKLLGLFPEYLEPDPTLFPLAPITFLFREADPLTHRDFLGSFMALGIERDVVGDILTEKGRCVAFFRREMEPYILQNIRKIGRTGVRIVPGQEGPLPLRREFLELSGVVASQRLDCLVAFLCRTSREKAAGMVSSGLVLLNHREALSVSQRVQEADVLSIRGYGRFIIDRLGPVTAKGRLAAQCRKYK